MKNWWIGLISALVIIAGAASSSDLGEAGSGSKRTLTNLYNTRPTWLDLAHKRLD